MHAEATFEPQSTFYGAMSRNGQHVVTVQSGGAVTYTLTLSNDGPGPGDGAVVTDPAIAGVDCSAGTLTCGGATGGAVCPASPTVADLQNTGLIIPVLPAGGSLQLTLSCTVTASGEP